MSALHQMHARKMLKIEGVLYCLYLDMVLVVSLHNRIGIEIVFTTDSSTCIARPLHVLSSASEVFVIVHQTQDQANTMTLSLRDHKIQSLMHKQSSNVAFLVKSLSSYD